jgi:translation initiation factor IF-3
VTDHPRRRQAATPTHRSNRAIRAPQVRLIDDNGTQCGVVSLAAALAAAEAAGLDLVEVAPQATPPVCRIVSWSKFRYELQRKERASRSKAVDVKEIKFSVRIGAGDRGTKCRKIVEMLNSGDHVKVVVQMKGREVSHPELADRCMEQVLAAVGDAGRCETQVRRQGRSLNVVLVPRR